MFCPKCGGLLVPKKENGKTVLVCSCGYKKKAEGSDVTLKEAGKKSKPVEVVEKEEKVNVIVDAKCPKCGYGKAEYWEVQTRAADEPPTRFFKCLKCGHTWREYG